MVSKSSMKNENIQNVINHEGLCSSYPRSIFFCIHVYSKDLHTYPSYWTQMKRWETKKEGTKNNSNWGQKSYLLGPKKAQRFSL